MVVSGKEYMLSHSMISPNHVLCFGEASQPEIMAMTGREVADKRHSHGCGKKFNTTISGG
jgi:hypothetical protein